jgi:hypothetical protein
VSDGQVESLKRVYEVLQGESISYVLVGGQAANLYRGQPRLAQDVDVAVLGQPESRTREICEAMVEELGLMLAVGWMEPDRLKSQAPITMVLGQAKDGLNATVEFLLPNLPWVRKGVKRAQSNLVDFGFAKIPTATPEDLIIAKCFALETDPSRSEDLDDLKQILTVDNQLDFSYLLSELNDLQLMVPEIVMKHLPNAVRRILGRMRR